MKITKTKKTVVTDKIRYWITDKIKVLEVLVDEKLQSRTLTFSGKHPRGLDVVPIYAPNLAACKTDLDFHELIKELSADLPENAEDIKLKDIIFAAFYDHTLYDVNFRPIPILRRHWSLGTSDNFDVQKMKKKLEGYKFIKSVSTSTVDEDCDCWNSFCSCEMIKKEAIEEIVYLPTRKMLETANSMSLSIGDYLFDSAYWHKNNWNIVSKKLNIDDLDPFNLKRLFR